MCIRDRPKACAAAAAVVSSSGAPPRTSAVGAGSCSPPAASRRSSIMRTMVGTPRTWVGRCSRTAAIAASGVKWSSRTSVPPCRARVTAVPLEPKAEASGTRKRQRGGVRSGMREARKFPRPPASALCEYAIILGSASEPEERRMRAALSGSGRAGTNPLGSERRSPLSRIVPSGTSPGPAAMTCRSLGSESASVLRSAACRNSRCSVAAMTATAPARRSRHSASRTPRPTGNGSAIAPSAASARSAMTALRSLGSCTPTTSPGPIPSSLRPVARHRTLRSSAV